jgi:NAD(P)-dependent dehydrogenase (short-subunit alcohol dehydrogenase family)
MDLQLKGKRALVTGSTAGIGLAIATQLAAEGANVIVNGRTQKRVDDAIAAVKRGFSAATLTGVAADLSTAAGANELLRQLPDLDILVNNMGIFEPKPFEQIADEDWMRLFETNVMSGIRLSRAYLPGMRSRDWGRIIFISSESAVQIPGEMIHYGMTKTAQLAVARGIAETTVGTNITVNSVLVGPTRSEGVAEFIGALAKAEQLTPEQVETRFFQHMRPTSLLKRFIEPAEVGNIVAYLCSPRASATTGAAVRADGGVVRSIL